MWSPGLTLAELEKRAIKDALRFFNGDKNSTANALGICLRTLTNKFKEYGWHSAYDGNQEAEESASKTDEQTTGVETESRVRVQPPTEAPKEQSMSMRKRIEVQKMSSK